MAKELTLEMLAEQMQQGFAKLEKLMERGFAAVAEDGASLREDIADIKHRMATKEQIIKLHTQINAIETELRDIRRSLTRVVYREDIDDALARIAAIEKHLGINKKIAA